jgi:hypothetical protein
MLRENAPAWKSGHARERRTRREALGRPSRSRLGQGDRPYMPPTIPWIAIAVVLLGPTLEATQATSVSAGGSPSRTTTKTALAYETVVQGTGAVAKRGDTVRIHETLSLPDGRVIFNSREKRQTVTFVLGANQVIPGVDEGVTGMRVGERRKLLLPPALDGRTFDPSFIQPDAIRHYDIELTPQRRSRASRRRTRDA